MAGKYLGVPFDIHAGGEDLIFPHHENEIAQSEGATDCPFARYWLHNGFVTVNGEKMSKSLGNFVTIRQALQRFSPEAVKLLLLSTNYRSPLDYSEAAVEEKARALAGMREFLRHVETLQAEQGAAAAGEPDPSWDGAFREAMDDDLNTARATGVLFDLVREGNRLLQEARRPGEAARHLPALAGMAAALRRLGARLTLDITSGLTLVARLDRISLGRSLEAGRADLERLLGDRQAPESPRRTRLAEVLLELLALRELARRDRNWAVADEIRLLLADRGVRLDDSRSATHAAGEFAAGQGLPPVAVTLLKL